MASRQVIPSGLQSVPLDSAFFEVVGASVVGSSHLARGKPCEDFFRLEASGDWIIAVVSDGAGSATRAAAGARIASEEICRALITGLLGGASRQRTQSDALSSWTETIISEGIVRARERCLAEAREEEGLAAFHATVVGALIVDQDCILFHIGDGCASAHRNTASGIETIAFSEPENGEYVNQTFFFTESWWRQHLRITEIPGRADEVWLMTDGAYELVVPPNQKQLREFSVTEINRLVFAEPAGSRSSILAEILSSHQAQQRSEDDKTLVIIRRR